VQALASAPEPVAEGESEQVPESARVQAAVQAQAQA